MTKDAPEHGGRSIDARGARRPVRPPRGGVGRLAALVAALLAACATARDGVETATPTTRANPLSAACERGELVACRRLGILYEEGGGGVTLSDVQAARLHERACDGGDLESCARLGALLVEGANVSHDPTRAAQLLQRACDGGSAYGCEHFGGLSHNGRGVDRDLRAAARWYERACDAGGASACQRMAALAAADDAPSETSSERTPSARTRRFAERALALWQAACRSGDLLACVEEATIYYGDFLGVHEPEPARAVPLLRRACDAGVLRGCMDLSNLYVGGEGVPRDIATAHSLRASACAGGLGIACVAAGYDLLAPSTREGEVGAARFFGRACDLGELNGCWKLGAMLAQGAGVPRDEARAADLYRRGCDRGNVASCGSLAAMYFWGRGVAQDLDRASDMERARCERWMDNPSFPQWGACETYAVLALHAAPSGERTARGIEFLTAGCDHGDPSSCVRLGVAYATGRGVDVDASRATPLWQRARARLTPLCAQHPILPDCALLGRLTLRGLGGPPDAARAVAVLRPVCDVSPEHCGALALAARAAGGATASSAEVASWLDRACESRDATSCARLADAYDRGDGVSRDAQRAAALRRDAARDLATIVRASSDEEVGVTLGRMHLSGVGVERDATRAAEAFEHACWMGSAEACLELAALSEAGATPDASRARALRATACALGATRGCTAP